MIERSWLIQESSGLKPDWFLDIKLFSMKNSNILSYNNLSKILPAIGSNDIVWYSLVWLYILYLEIIA